MLPNLVYDLTEKAEPKHVLSSKLTTPLRSAVEHVEIAEPTLKTPLREKQLPTLKEPIIESLLPKNALCLVESCAPRFEFEITESDDTEPMDARPATEIDDPSLAALLRDSVLPRPT